MASGVASALRYKTQSSGVNHEKKDDLAMTHFQQEVQRVETSALTPSQKEVTRCIVTFLGIRPHNQFTPYVINTWCRVLGEFQIEIVNQAVLECALSLTEFVGLQHIFQRCRELSVDRSLYRPHKNEREIPKSLIHKIAQNLGVDAGQKSVRTPVTNVRASSNG